MLSMVGLKKWIKKVKNEIRKDLLDLFNDSMTFICLPDKLREPPVIVGGMDSNVTVVAPLVAVLQCKVRSPVVPTVRWFRRLQSSGATAPLPSQNLVQYLNNTYQASAPHDPILRVC